MLRNQTFIDIRPPGILLDSGFFENLQGELDYATLIRLRTALQGRLQNIQIRLYTTSFGNIAKYANTFSKILSLEDYEFYDFTNKNHVLRFVANALASNGVLHRGTPPAQMEAIRPKFSQLSFEEFCGLLSAISQGLPIPSQI